MWSGKVVLATLSSIASWRCIPMSGVSILLLQSLFHEFSCNHSKTFLDTFPVLCVDLVTRIPSKVLIPHARAPLATWCDIAIRVARIDAHCFPHPLYRALEADFPPGLEVRLAANDMYDAIVFGILSQLLQPSLHLFPALFGSNVVAQYPCVGTSVVQTRYAPKAFLPCGIPYLKANGCVRVWIGEKSRVKGCADSGGWLREREAEVWVEEALYQGGLADALGADDN